MQNSQEYLASQEVPRWQRAVQSVSSALLASLLLLGNHPETATFYDHPVILEEVDAPFGLTEQPSLNLSITETIGSVATTQLPPDDLSLKIMTLNAHNGDLKGGLDPLIEFLRTDKPAIACFQEANVAMIEEIHQRTGMVGVYEDTRSPRLFTKAQGNAILVSPSQQILSSDSRALPSPMNILPKVNGVESKRTKLDVYWESLWHPRRVLTLDTVVAGQHIRVVNAHTSYEQFTSDLHLNTVGQMLEDADVPTFGCGDLNAQPQTVALSRIGALVTTGQINGRPTFLDSPVSGRKVDYIVSPQCIATSTTTRDFGSDHQAETTDFSFESCFSVDPMQVDALIPLATDKIHIDPMRIQSTLKAARHELRPHVRPLKDDNVL